MRKWVKLSAVLSWTNGIIWGLFVARIVLLALFSQVLGLLIVAFFFSVLVLHSYAALQLNKSIRRPEVPLSNQTPVGIRFVGFVALFLGVIFVADGIAFLKNSGEILQLLQAQVPQFKTLTIPAIRGLGIAFLLLGICIGTNVVLNFRLLRWYYFTKQSVG